MRRRLQEYEQRSVQATLEVQRATRALVLENKLLRVLLTQHGVSCHEIAHISHSRSLPQMPGSTHTALGSGSAAIAVYDTDITDLIPPEHGTDDDRLPGSSTYDGVDGPADPANVFEAFSLPPPQSVRNTARAPVELITTSRTETSCDIAATILADVHGCNDKSLVFAALGCPEAEDCVVKNVRIFELIDQMP